MPTDNSTPTDIVQHLEYLPIFVTEFGFVTDASVLRHLGVIEDLLKKKEPYVSIIVTPTDVPDGLDDFGIIGLTANHRKWMAEFGRHHTEALNKYCLGASFVMESRVVLGMLTAIFWLVRPAHPYKTVSNLATAWDQAELWLQQGGVEPPPRPSLDTLIRLTPELIAQRGRLVHPRKPRRRSV